MVLAELRSYLQENKRVLLVDLANRFNSDPDALRGMLQKWVSKGKVRKVSGEKGCSSGCCKCDPATLEFYEWLG
ncbi:MAG: FeoC-like transcriptional regulator [Gammaproteobacteria bacterium]